MEKNLAKLLIQLFAEEESETTDYEDVTEEESEVEYTDGVEDESEETSEPVEESTEEPEKVKTFTQEELNSIVESRLKRERDRMGREHKQELSKYEELAYLTQTGLKANDLDETLEKSRSFYGRQGIKYTPKPNTEDEEILANAYTQKILNECDSIEDIEVEVNRLLKKDVNMTSREQLVVQGLIGEMKSRQRLSDLNKLGAKEDVYNSKEFKDFEKMFDKNTPIATIYDLYNSKNKTRKSVVNPGSMKSTPNKEIKKFISEAEYDRMTEKEIEENLDLIKESMTQW
jgi:hypothetical protein